MPASPPRAALPWAPRPLVRARAPSAASRLTSPRPHAASAPACSRRGPRGFLFQLPAQGLPPLPTAPHPVRFPVVNSDFILAAPAGLWRRPRSPALSDTDICDSAGGVFPRCPSSKVLMATRVHLSSPRGVTGCAPSLGLRFGNSQGLVSRRQLQWQVCGSGVWLRLPAAGPWKVLDGGPPSPLMFFKNCAEATGAAGGQWN